ncbi:hypothetical protein GRF29_106g197450 [Pseudopithomyces chartarum]|uniref:Uncharacterized protein n=1 Tax=Pseudopithomyces chartarum TaxID=1892770 RepID=A0AAN6LSI1_9PLEO|nr:hypothetical protein GRF29_106g197450 [Pseudopithomyces chartarum]
MEPYSHSVSAIGNSQTLRSLDLEPGVAAGAFAIATIFFVPLAFLTALFTLKIQGFERLMIMKGPKEPNTDAPGPDSIYSGGKMAGILVGSVILTFMITGTLVFASMKWLNIDIKDLKFERGSFQEGKVNSRKVKEAEIPVTVSASTLNHERESSIRETTPEKAKKTGLAAAFSVARKRLSTKKDIEAQ